MEKNVMKKYAVEFLFYAISHFQAAKAQLRTRMLIDVSLNMKPPKKKRNFVKHKIPDFAFTTPLSIVAPNSTSILWKS